MGSLGQTMLRSVKRMADEHISEQVARQRIGAFAKARLAELIDSGQGSRVYTRTVDGVPNAPEESVKLVGGRIVYEFAKGAEAIRFALKFATENSPDPGGPYSQAWFIAVDGVAWTRPIDTIPAGSVVMLINYAPYARALEEGGRTGRSGRAKGHPHPQNIMSERTRQAVKRAFPGLDVTRTYVSLPGIAGARAFGWEIPYHLRTGRDRGMPVLYPAVVIKGL